MGTQKEQGKGYTVEYRYSTGRYSGSTAQRQSAYYKSLSESLKDFNDGTDPMRYNRGGVVGQKPIGLAEYQQAVAHWHEIYIFFKNMYRKVVHALSKEIVLDGQCFLSGKGDYIVIPDKTKTLNFGQGACAYCKACAIPLVGSREGAYVINCKKCPLGSGGLHECGVPGSSWSVFRQAPTAITALKMRDTIMFNPPKGVEISMYLPTITFNGVELR